MMPAEIVPGAVSMGPDCIAKLDHFRDQFVAGQLIEIGIHTAPVEMRRQTHWLSRAEGVGLIDGLGAEVVGAG
jgi:hypothetical protein